MHNPLVTMAEGLVRAFADDFFVDHPMHGKRGQDFLDQITKETKQVNLLQNYAGDAFVMPAYHDEPHKRIYIAGPMRGIPEFNFPAFFAAEQMLVDKGWLPFNPARADNDKFGTDVSAGNTEGDEALAGKQYGFTIQDAMQRDTHYITRLADAIYMLKGWENSTGARAEHALAVCLRLAIYYQETL